MTMHKTVAPHFRSRSLALLVTGVLGGGVLVGCAGSGSSRPSPKAVAAARTSVSATRPGGPTGHLSTGKSVAALNFSVGAAQNVAPDSVSPSTPASLPLAAESTPAAAVKALIGAALEGDSDTAWSQVSTADRDRIGVKQRIIEQVNAGGWTGFTIGATLSDKVTIEVVQTPRISDIDGVIASSSTVQIPTMKEGSGYKVVWSRRITEQHYPDVSGAQDAAVMASVKAWALSRQACDRAPTNEYTSGLIGVVGLGAALCHTTAAPIVASVGDLETLDEPQPVLEGFGGSALLWARVAKISGPVAMNVVVAPKGTDWIVVAIARPSISDS